MTKTITEERQDTQRRQCEAILEAWLPVASDPSDDNALKAIPVLLRVMERLSDLDGLDTAKPSVDAVAHTFADPLELAERIKVVSPVLSARLAGWHGQKEPPQET